MLVLRSNPEFPGLPKLLVAFTRFTAFSHSLFHYACLQFRGDRGNEIHEPNLQTERR
jgi:hypothetical protein